MQFISRPVLRSNKKNTKNFIILTGISLLFLISVQNISSTNETMVGSFLARKVTKNIDLQRGFAAATATAGGAVGRWAGAKVGAAIGTAVAPGIGTVIGAGVGAL